MHSGSTTPTTVVPPTNYCAMAGSTVLEDSLLVWRQPVLNYHPSQPSRLQHTTVCFATSIDIGALEL